LSGSRIQAPDSNKTIDSRPADAMLISATRIGRNGSLTGRANREERSNYHALYPGHAEVKKSFGRVPEKA
jgi:hypothetical protein